MRIIYTAILFLMSGLSFGSEIPPAAAGNANSPATGTASAAAVETQGASPDRTASQQGSNIRLADCCVVLGVRG
ncbi:MAG: hypothetical protein HYY79_06505 [Betaproteobacteria bacterium]|nr:hypothetical protein [Betaproteobacteria bacterium]